MIQECFKSKGAMISFLKTCLNINILIPENTDTSSNCPEVFPIRGDGDVLCGDRLWSPQSEPGRTSRPLPALESTGDRAWLCPSAGGGCCPVSLAHNRTSDSALDSRLLIQTFTGQLPQWHWRGCARKEHMTIHHDALAFKRDL